jgi:hypothetical protein
LADSGSLYRQVDFKKSIRYSAAVQDFNGAKSKARNPKKLALANPVAPRKNSLPKALLSFKASMLSSIVRGACEA